MDKLNRNRVLWITRTALFIALLIVGQFVTKSGTQLLTGSVVNFLLVASALTAGIYTGLTVAVISPVFAKLLGIGPLWPIVPVIAVGNAVIVIVFSILVGKADKLEGAKRYILWGLSVLSGAATKFLVLYFGVVKIVLPIMSDNLPEGQILKISKMFTFPQLFTALIGGAAAMVIVPSIKAALKKSKIGQ